MARQTIVPSLQHYIPVTSLIILSNGRIVCIALDEITHISRNGCDSVIHTTRGSYITFSSLQALLNDLPPDEFFRIHKSHIVSLRHMTKPDRNKMKVYEYWLPMSDYFKKKIISQLAKQLDRLVSFSMFDD